MRCSAGTCALSPGLRSANSICSKNSCQSVSDAVWLPTVQSVQWMSLISTHTRFLRAVPAGHITKPGGSVVSVMAMLPQEGDQMREYIDRNILAHENILMPITW